MPSRVPPIARIRLARSWPRLLAWPLVVAGTGALALVSWATGSFGAGIGGLAFAILGGALVVVGLAVAAILASVRLDVEESAIRLRWLGGQRLYTLTPGAVTRVRLRGENASPLRSRIGVLGWGIGAARLRDEEEIQVVRLARTATAILAPTDRGRLAIAPASEDQLLDALSRAARAARARQRLEELAADAPAVEASHEIDAVQDTTPVVEAAPPVLTGIERARLEERLAAERTAALAAAESEREAARASAAAPPGGPDREAGLVDTAPLAGAAAVRRARWSGARGLTLRRPRPAAALVLLPLLGAAVAWGIGLVQGTMPPAGSDLGRLTALALVLAGPATSVGAIMARAWWPRIVGVVIAGGLASSVFIARALVGS